MKTVFLFGCTKKENKMSGTQIESGRKRSRWSFSAITHILKTKLARQPSTTLESVAVNTWEIAPSDTSITPPAFYLPNQLERITGWRFASEHPRRTLEGGITIDHGATRGFLLKDVCLIDGAFYKNNAHSWMSPRTNRLPRIHIDNEIDRGAVYCTAGGNKWFGSWIMDDCVTYPLACAEGIPVTTKEEVNFQTVTRTYIAHAPGYENWLSMKPARVNNTFFRELVIFGDLNNNQHKHQRFRTLRDQLLSHVNVGTHPGVFILRGGGGDPRLLQNELELAEHLRDHRGFRILDPTKTEVPDIVATCAGAKTVVGVEGSQLIHGIVLLQPGCSILTLQPPDRFVSAYKHVADRELQHFGFVVGKARGKGFYIDPVEVDRTLDLFPA